MSTSVLETPAPAALPSGTVTFLFTDIEGSTRLWQAHPSAMQDALAQHHAILQRAISAHGGSVFQIIGDAFCAAFVRPLDAVQAAVAAQRALHLHAWGATGPLRVRIGLHTGEAETRDGDYLSSPTLIRVQRVMTAGHGGQTLLSAATQELVRDQLPATVSLKDLGAHHLKDLVRAEHLFQLCAADLPTDFPPLRTLDAHPHNLPTQLTSFIGREHDLAEVKRLLASTRLLTLTGVGGTGKTRLALQVAGDLLASFAEGAWFITLAPIADPALVAQAVAAVLNVREQTGRPLLETLSDYLRARHALLVLDNCEHLIDACAQLTETLLQTCPHVKILATSREALGIIGETTWYVPSLSAPHPHHLPAADEREALLAEMTRYEAVRLFVERTVAVQPSFALTPQNAQVVAQICHRLDGIPLAVELAAARMKALSLEQIAARLDDRFNLLTVGSRTALPRHQTLRATIDWSYDLLSAEEQQLLARLSVFAGGWTLEAAEFACGRIADTFSPPHIAMPTLDILDLLTHLVDKSLVVMEQSDGAARYRLLETLRQYGREKLSEAGESETTQRRHLQYCLQLADEAEPRLRAADQIRWLDRLEAEHDNLRAALDFALEQGLRVEGLRLAADLARFWYLRGYWSEGREWLERSLTPTPEPLERELALARARALGGAGWLADESGADEAAYTESLALCKRWEEPWGVAFALRGLGVVAYNQGDEERAGELLDESLARFSELNDAWGIALVHFNWGWLEFDENQQQQAQASWEASERYFRQTGDRWGIAVSRGALSYIARLQGDYKLATKLSKESLSLFKELGDKAGIATSLSRLANVAYRRDDFKQATSLFEESIALQKELGYERDTAYAYSVLAQIACYQGDFARAHALLDKSFALWRDIRDKTGMAVANTFAASLAYYAGEVAKAAALWQEALPAFRERHDRSATATALLGVGRAATRSGEVARAAQALDEGLQLAREVGDKQLIASALFAQASATHAQGDHARASALYHESLSLRRDSGAKRGVAECLEGLARLASECGEHERAAQLVGAAEALREVLGAPLLPIERAGAEHSVAMMRAHLGDEAFRRAWDAGRALSMEPAIELAMQAEAVPQITTQGTLNEP